MRDSTLLFHYPCFDGLISAAIASDYLEHAFGWTIAEYCPVNYDRAATWLSEPLPPASAIVDFLYHPDARFWIDHHATAFLTPEAKQSYEDDRNGRFLVYDARARSCAALLWRLAKGVSSAPQRFGEMAAWADRIDSANYLSVQQAVYGSDPALEINHSLAIEADDAYGHLLLHALRTSSLSAVARRPEVRWRVDEVRARTARGMREVERSSHLEGDVAVIDVAPEPDATINRYSAYAVFPDARYSVALIRNGPDAKITAMRNPWLEFESVELGELFRKFGGGGHQRVASVVLRPDSGTEPEAVLREIVREIRAADLYPELQRASA